MQIFHFPIPDTLVDYVDRISLIDLGRHISIPVYAWSRGHIVVVEHGDIDVDIPGCTSFKIDEGVIWGPQLKPGQITSGSNGVRGWVIMLGGGVTPAFMGCSCQAVVNDFIPLSKLYPGLHDLERKSILSYVDIVSLLQKLLMRYDFYSSWDIRFRQKLMHTLSNSPVNMTADILGVSQSTLERRTKLLFGVSPKILAKLQRFYTCVPLLGQLCDTDVATMAGYYDQSHYIQEFKLFTGLTPGKFRKMRECEYMSLYHE